MDTYKDIPYDIDFGVLSPLVDALVGFGTMAFSVLSVILVVYMALVTTFDIMYITFPMIQSMASKRNLDGSLDISGLKFRVISRDAYNAVQEKYSIEGSGRGLYKSALLIYLRKRLKTYLVLAVVLVVMFNGFNVIVLIISKLLTPLFKAFKIFQ
jgi:hypothetical protein